MENFKHIRYGLELKRFAPKKLVLAYFFSAIMSMLNVFSKDEWLTISTLLWKDFI
jgi:hypothetical protein